MLHGLCLEYLEMMNLLSKPEMTRDLDLRKCMQRNALTQNEIAEKLVIDLDRLKLILYNLDIFINFKPPLNRYEKVEEYAHLLDCYLSNKATKNFLFNKTHELVTKHGTIKDTNEWRF